MNKKFEKRLNELGKLSGYQKPAKVNDVLKLDSNENLAIKKEFQTELIREAQKRSDIRTYPLGGVENLINSLAKYLKVLRPLWFEQYLDFVDAAVMYDIAPTHVELCCFLAPALSHERNAPFPIGPF